MPTIIWTRSSPIIRHWVPTLTDALKHQMIKDYRKSPELASEIMKQFRDSHQSARENDKERMQAASLDPSILDSSDDETEA